MHPDCDMWFVTEVLGPRFDYARHIDSEEEGDRGADARMLWDLVRSLEAGNWRAITPGDLFRISLIVQADSVAAC